MKDLILDVFGASIIGLTGLIYLKYPRENLIRTLVEKEKQSKEEIDGAIEEV